MKFLETITGWGDEVLVPINKIELIWIKYGEGGWEIHIKGDGQFEWVEHFGKDEDKINDGFEMIKYLLGVPNMKDALKEMKAKTKK